MSFLVKELQDPKLLQEQLGTINKVRDSFMPFSKHLENEDKVGMRVMAEGREGYARLVSRIAIQHDNTLAKTDNSQELADRLLYNEALDANRIATMEYLELLTDTQSANSADIMSMVDRYADSLERGRRNNSALDSAMKEIDDWNSRYSHAQVTEKPMPPAVPPTNNTTNNPSTPQ